MIFISINKSIGYIQRATEEGSMVKTYNVQCSMALFINAANWFFYLKCAIKWENIKLMDSITSHYYSKPSCDFCSPKIISEQKKGKEVDHPLH